jgi:hypothetical protein
LPGRCVDARKEIDTTASHNAGYFPDRNSTGRWIAGLAAAGGRVGARLPAASGLRRCHRRPAGPELRHVKEIVGKVWPYVIVGIALGAAIHGYVPEDFEALLGKGAALGTVLAFMMSVIALSAPEMVILRKVLKPRLIAVFVGVVAGGILLVGYVFNLVL